MQDEEPEKPINSWIDLELPPEWTNGEWGWFTKLFYVAGVAACFYGLFHLQTWLEDTFFPLH